MILVGVLFVDEYAREARNGMEGKGLLEDLFGGLINVLVETWEKRQ